MAGRGVILPPRDEPSQTPNLLILKPSLPLPPTTVSVFRAVKFVPGSADCLLEDRLWLLEPATPHYEMEKYAQEHLADDAVNVNCVASWRARADGEGRVESLFVDLHDSWSFDSRRWNGRADAPGRMLGTLFRNERGRCGGKRMA